jgi:hypothetical protein
MLVLGKFYALITVPGIHVELSELTRKRDILLGVSRKRGIIGEARETRRIKGGF